MCKKRGLSTAIIASLCVLLTACGSTGTTSVPSASPSSKDSSDGPLTKYASPVSITAAMQDAGFTRPSGTDFNNNPWIKGYKSALNIDVKVTTVGSLSNDEYKTKINTAIASDSLPDVFSVDATQYQQLAEAEKIIDINGVFNAYASDATKKKANQDNGASQAAARLDGKLYAIVQPAGYGEMSSMIWVRTDWLEKCGLQAPKTIDDVWNIAKTFKGKKLGGASTVGLAFTNDIINNLTPFTALANCYGAYPHTWIDGGSGNLIYGSTTDAMKTFLSKFQEMYKAGVIDHEFGSNDKTKMYQTIAAGRAGIFFGDFCSPFDLVNSYKQDNKAAWQSYKIVTNDGSLAKTQVNTAFMGGWVISSKCKNPEAVIKMLNFAVDKIDNDPETYNLNGLNNYAVLKLTSNNDNIRISADYQKYLKDSAVKPTDEAERSTFSQCDSWLKSKDLTSGYAMYNIFGPKGSIDVTASGFKNDGFLVSPFRGAKTETMVSKGGSLDTIEQTAIINIMIGTKDISSFDTFVSQWNANGGNQETTEVNKWLSEHK